MRACACSPSLDGREARAFYFIVCVSSVVSASSGTTTAQDWRGRKQKTQRQIRTIFLRKSRTRRSENSEKPSQNRRKIDEKSLLAGFGRPKPFRGRVGTRSGRVREAPKPGRERSWDAPGEPRAAGRRPRASPGRSQDAPGLVRSDVGARAARQAPSDESSERFFVVFALSRVSSDVLFVSVFTCLLYTSPSPRD